MRVYCEVRDNPPTSAGPRVGAMIKEAGGVPFSRGIVNVKKLESFAPDIMIASWNGVGLKIDRTKIYSRNGWQDVKAIKDKPTKMWQATRY